MIGYDGADNSGSRPSSTSGIFSAAVRIVTVT